MEGGMPQDGAPPSQAPLNDPTAIAADPTAAKIAKVLSIEEAK